MKIKLRHVINFIFVLVILADILLLYLKFIKNDNISSNSIIILLIITVQMSVLVILNKRKQ